MLFVNEMCLNKVDRILGIDIVSWLIGTNFCMFIWELQQHTQCNVRFWGGLCVWRPHSYLVKIEMFIWELLFGNLIIKVCDSFSFFFFVEDKLSKWFGVKSSHQVIFTISDLKLGGYCIFESYCRLKLGI